jgi:AcrR family transcriptional regulator
MARAALSAKAVVGLALEIVDESGPAALTLAAVAARAGVAPPSLYKHVRNLAELRVLVSGQVMEEFAEHGNAAVLGRSGDDALRALMRAWRAYVVRNPHRYAAILQSPEPATAAIAERLVDILLAALRAYDLEGSQAIHAARCLRAAAHGFAVLETGGAFQLPEDLDESYELLIDMVIAGLRREPPRS